MERQGLNKSVKFDSLTAGDLDALFVPIQGIKNLLKARKRC